MEIILFKSKDCPKCKTVEYYLDSLQVEYTKANLSGRGSGKYKAMLIKRGITILSVPALLVDDKLYREDQLLEDGLINPEISKWVGHAYFDSL